MGIFDDEMKNINEKLITHLERRMVDGLECSIDKEGKVHFVKFADRFWSKKEIEMLSGIFGIASMETNAIKRIEENAKDELRKNIGKYLDFIKETLKQM